MLEVSNGLRYVPVAKALKERRPNQSEATFNLQWQRLFRVFFLCLIKKDPDKETTIYYSSSSNISACHSSTCSEDICTSC